jgi:hypothetical protein
LSATDEPISFEQHIKPLFRERDRESMKPAFDLWSHDDVARNSEAILGRLREGTMPWRLARRPNRRLSRLGRGGNARLNVLRQGQPASR